MSGALLAIPGLATSQTLISACTEISGVRGPAIYKVVSEIASCPQYGIRVVNSSDVVIDLNGQNITGSQACGASAIGISVENSPRTLIHGNEHTPGAPVYGATIRGWDRGIRIIDSPDSTIAPSAANGGIYVLDNLSAGVSVTNSPRITLQGFASIRNGVADIDITNTEAPRLRSLAIGANPIDPSGPHTGVRLTNSPNAILLGVGTGASGPNTFGIWIDVGSNNAEIRDAFNQYNNATGAAIRVSAPGAILRGGTFNLTGHNACDVMVDGGASVQIFDVKRFPSLPLIRC